MPKSIRRNPKARCSSLLKAVQTLIGTKGINSMTIEDIVREAKVAKGTFYLYFKSKDDVINAVAELMVDDLINKFLKKTKDKTTPITDRFLGLAKVLVEIANIPYAQELSLVIHQPGYWVMHKRMEEKTATRLIPTIEKIISEGITAQIFNADNPHVYACLVVGSFLGLDYALEDPAKIDEAVGHLSKFILKGLGYKESDSHE